MGLDFLWNINIKVKLFLQIRNKQAWYPAPAQNFWIDTNRLYARFAVDIPPFLSWILAAWTTTDNKQSSTSTTMCRLLSFLFPSVNSRLLHVHVQLRIPLYRGATSFHCWSVKSLGYDSRFCFSVPLFYYILLLFWIQVLTTDSDCRRTAVAHVIRRLMSLFLSLTSFSSAFGHSLLK